MQQYLTARLDHLVGHSETPPELWSKPTPKHNLQGGEQQQAAKKAKTHPNKNNWHPTLKSKLEKPMEIANNPTYSKILKYCGTNPAKVAIFPQSQKMCSPNAFLGRCFDGENCTRSHALPSNDQVEEILKLVKKFEENPHGLTGQ